MKKILVASSSTSFLDRNRSLFSRSDFFIITTTSGKDALELLRNEEIDLIISDIQLEDMEGEELFEMVKGEGEFPGLSRILICRDTKEEFERLSGCGVNALIARPIKPMLLVKTVSQFLTVQLPRSRRVSLRVKVISKKEVLEFFCLSHNISITGILIEAEYRFEIGSILTCIFSIPESVQVEVEGEIVRSARTIEGFYQYGINFISLGRTYRNALEKYISRVAKGDVANN